MHLICSDPISSPTLQGPSSNKFANDGSFLQQFMKMQKEKSNSVPGQCLHLHSFCQRISHSHAHVRREHQYFVQQLQH